MFLSSSASASMPNRALISCSQVLMAPSSVVNGLVTAILTPGSARHPLCFQALPVRRSLARFTFFKAPC